MSGSEFDDNQMLASKMLCRNIENLRISLIFEENSHIYNFQMSRYYILIDQYEFLNKNMKFQLSLKVSENSLFKYYILKVILFYIKWLHLIVDKKINQFNLKNFDNFAESPEYAALKKAVIGDLEKYTAEFQQAYQDLLEFNEGYFSEEIYKSIEPEVIVTYKLDYAKLPRAYKLTYRAALMTIFSKLYDMSQRFFENKEKIAIQINDIFEKKQFSKKEGILRLKFAFRILIACTITKLINFKDRQIVLENKKFELT